MESTAQTILATVLATWAGAIGIGLITVGMRLNNTVQRMAMIVRALSRQHLDQKREISALKEDHAGVHQRLARLEANQ